MQPAPPLISYPIKWSSIELHAGEKLEKIQELNKRIQEITDKTCLAQTALNNLTSQATPEELEKYKTQIAKNKKLFKARSKGERLPIDEAMRTAEKIWKEKSQLASLKREKVLKKNELETESVNLSRTLETLAQKYSGVKTPDVLTNKPLADSIKLRITENNSKEYVQTAEVIVAQARLDVFDEGLIRDLKRTEDKYDPILKPVVANFVKYLNKVQGAESPSLYLLPLIAKSPLYAAHLLSTIPLDVSEAAQNYFIEKLNPTDLAALAKACVLYDGIKVLRKEKPVTEFLRGNSLIEMIPAYYQKLYLGPIFNDDEWTNFFLTCLSINSMELEASKLEGTEEYKKKTIGENQVRILRKATTSLDRITVILANKRDVMPTQLKQLYQAAWDILNPLSASTPHIQKKQLAAFFFLRFFNPQLIMPKEPHAPIQQRDAIHLAKLLQSVANNENPDQDFMQFVGTFIKDRQPQIEAITTLLRE